MPIGIFGNRVQLPGRFICAEIWDTKGNSVPIQGDLAIGNIPPTRGRNRST